MRRLLEQLSRPTIRSAICGCSSISWIKNYRWLDSSGGVPESDLHLTDSYRYKPYDSASKSFLSWCNNSNTVGKLVGQYSDSDRVSHSLQILSRKSERLKSHESREGRERIHSASSERGGDWLGACESLRTIDSASESHCGDRAPRRGGGELTHR